ncbi:MAG TPA: hypothetical protein VF727_03025 [Allosphingosinicella sp.]|jgi:hypothetical protein
MTRAALTIAMTAATLSLAACGGGGGGDAAGANEAADGMPGQSVNAADGINVTDDASGTTGSTTGDAGGPLNLAGDAAADANEANGAAANAQ